MGYKEGYAASIGKNKPLGAYNNPKNVKGDKSPIKVGIIIEIFITPDSLIHDQTKNPGGKNSMGAIKCDITGNELVYPLFPNIGFIPTIGENVGIIELPVNSKSIYTPKYFYISPINYYGSNFLNKINGSQSNMNNITEWDNVINESLIVHKLIKQIGDTYIEGRFGNSVRLSGTLNNIDFIQLPWSEPTEKGKNNDPIIVIRNGENPEYSSLQPELPIEEDINGDLSSIYMTSYQKLPIEISRKESERFISYTTPPITPTQFSDPQIIGNSDRILLNAKKDNILLSAQKSVGVLSNESINLESTQINIHSKNLKLGSKNATESVLNGDLTVSNLKSLTKILRNLILSTLGTDPKYAAQSTSFITTLDLIEKQFDNCKSKNVKID